MTDDPAPKTDPEEHPLTTELRDRFGIEGLNLSETWLRILTVAFQTYYDSQRGRATPRTSLELSRPDAGAIDR